MIVEYKKKFYLNSIANVEYILISFVYYIKKYLS